MKTTKIAGTWMMFLLGISFLTLSLSGCSKENAADNSFEDLAYKQAVLDYTFTDTPTEEYLTSLKIARLDPLSPAEVEALLWMREEEYLAHDVYLTLSQLYTKPIFRNITRSELQHTSAVKLLITKYGLVDPAENHVTGTFANPDLQALYTTLVNLGSTSLLNGLIVGATIEDLDISDLQDHLVNIDNQDIICVFNNLMRGSRNHLRSFYANIVFLGGTYTPQYLTQEEFDAIVNSNHEIGPWNCN
jgi:hypothetical protein